MGQSPDVARFWEKVDRRGPNECWPWLASRRPTGHGRLRWGGRCEYAYRVSYVLKHGPIPPGQMIRHQCGNAWCVNPRHLKPGTHADNAADRAHHRDKPQVAPPRRVRCQMGRRPEPLKDRLLASVEIDAAGCWVWTKSRLSKPGGEYGQIGVGGIGSGGKMWSAHRLAYTVFIGPIPKGKLVLHSCDNPPCINPAHLRLGTHGDNGADMVARGRAARNVGRAPLQGEANGFAHLTAKAVREIRRSSKPQAALADRFGVTQSTISKVQLRKAWKHIE
jgi:hypothetical protein